MTLHTPAISDQGGRAQALPVTQAELDVALLRDKAQIVQS